METKETQETPRTMAQEAAQGIDWDAFARDLAQYELGRGRLELACRSIVLRGKALKLTAQAHGYAFEPETFVLEALCQLYAPRRPEVYAALVKDGRLARQLAAAI